MSEKPGASTAENAAGAGSGTVASDAKTTGNASTTGPKRPAPEGNPAFRMAGQYLVHLLFPFRVILTMSRPTALSTTFSELAHLPVHYGIDSICDILR